MTVMRQHTIGTRSNTVPVMPGWSDFVERCTERSGGGGVQVVGWGRGGGHVCVCVCVWVCGL